MKKPNIVFENTHVLEDFVKKFNLKEGDFEFVILNKLLEEADFYIS